MQKKEQESRKRPGAKTGSGNEPEQQREKIGGKKNAGAEERTQKKVIRTRAAESRAGSGCAPHLRSRRKSAGRPVVESLRLPDPHPDG